MLGWHIAVYRLTQPNALASYRNVAAPAAAVPTSSQQSSLLGTLTCAKRIAVWQPSGNLRWIDELTRDEVALALPGDGYPNTYLALARDLLPRVLPNPPEANATWAFGVHDVLSPGWAGKTVIDEQEAISTTPEEWLLVEAWDES